MIKKTLTSFLYAILFLALFSCDRPMCENQNPIFDKYEMESEEYKLELQNQINKIGQENLRYWLENYVKEGDKEFLMVFIQNDSLCARGKILVKNWTGKVSGMRTTKRGYQGAELKGLKFDFLETNGRIELVFQSLEWIRD